MPRLLNNSLSIFFLTVFFLILTGCQSREPEPLTKSGFYFDTSITLTVYGTEDDSILDQCLSQCRDYEQLLSRTITGSDINRVNLGRGKPVEVHAETAALINQAIAYGQLSGGIFDCSIAPLSTLWDFHSETHIIPSGSKLQSALSHVDYRKIKVHENTVTLEDPLMEIDLGGIAKGFIADQIKEYLESQNVSSALINLGGNVLAMGNKPDGSLWNIGIQRPFATAGISIATAAISDQSLVTSGVYERYFEKDGVLYHHLLDPSTGYPFENELYSVTILSDSSTEADALSTTCFGLGLEKGLEMIESLEGVEALFVTSDEELHYSKNFPR